MKNLFGKYRWLRLVFGVIMLAIGITTFVLAISGQGGNITKVISIVLGVYFLVVGLLTVIISLVAETRSKFPAELITGALFIGLGLSFLPFNNLGGVIDQVIAIIVPMILIAIGSVAIVKGIVLLAVKGSISAWIIALVIGAVSLATGIVFLCGDASVTGYIYALVGIVIIVVGTLETIAAIITLANYKKGKTTTVATVTLIEEKKTRRTKKSK